MELETFQNCSERLATRIAFLEDEILTDRVNQHLLKDPDLYKQLQNRKNIFDSVSTACDRHDKSLLPFSSSKSVSESSFRRSRAMWGSLTATPGFVGSDAPTQYDFNVTKKIKINSDVVIYTDSIYVKNGITEWIKKWTRNEWKNARKQPVKNKDLWIKLDNLCKDNKIIWKWVKGHSNNKYNNLADELATQSIK